MSFLVGGVQGKYRDPLPPWAVGHPGQNTDVSSVVWRMPCFCLSCYFCVYVYVCFCLNVFKVGEDIPLQCEHLDAATLGAPLFCQG